MEDLPHTAPQIAVRLNIVSFGDNDPHVEFARIFSEIQLIVLVLAQVGWDGMSALRDAL